MYGDVQNVKDRTGVEYSDLGFSSSTDLDDFITELLERASEYIERFTQREFTSNDATKTIDGKGSRSFMVPDHPVISISSIKIDGDTIDASNYKLKEPSGYRANNSGVVVRTDGGRWPYGNQNIEISYTWGYSTTPGPVKDVAEEIAADMLQTAVNNYKTGGLDSMNIEGFQTQFEDRFALNSSQRERLKPFKKIAFA